jgi:hypothetical protein
MQPYHFLYPNFLLYIPISSIFFVPNMYISIGDVGGEEPFGGAAPT